MARTEKMTSISSERLKYAREYYGLDVLQVSQKIKSIKPQDLNNYETGVDYPTYSKLEMLSNFYNRPLLYFFFKSPPQQEPLAVAFRSVENEIGDHCDMQIRTMMEKADFYRLNLQELYNNRNHTQFIMLLENDNIKTDTQLKSWLREKLDLSLEFQKKFLRADQLLEYLREKLFEVGVYVFKDSFRADDVSGLCLYDADFPVILLNNKTSFTRQVFTVFHEIYHLFCKEPDVYLPKMSEEKTCDRFASEFLIPSEDLEKNLKGRRNYEDKEFIDVLAKTYTVSPAAIAYRLKSSGKISREFYLSVQEDGIRKMNSEATGGNFYFTRISYLGKPYLKRIFTDYYQGKINISKVGEYTGLKAAHISKLSSNMFGGGF